MKAQFITNHQFNIGHICSRQQCDSGNGDKVAFRWIPNFQEKIDYTFLDLEMHSNKFANLLHDLGFSAGDVFFTFLPKMPQQFFAFLGGLKLQLIVGTLFANFGPEALLDRLADSQAKGIITTKSLSKKILSIRSQLPSLKFIIIVDTEENICDDTLSYSQLIKSSSDAFTAEITAPDTPSVLHYTSGSTGKPKGVLHAHRSVLFQNHTAKTVLTLQDDDIFWCTADQGWVTGTSYGIIGPWSLGVTQIHFGGSYDAEAWLRLLEDERVSIWYTAPTALRMLMQEDLALFNEFKQPKLRHIFSVGEPLNPEIINWSKRAFGKEIYDSWFQTETGGIMITNRPDVQIKPGSMGKPIEGVEAAILDDAGLQILDGERGNLCLKTGWPSMFITYINNQQHYNQKFKGGYYYTGDTAYRDEEGFYWFTGRSDDIINTAGHLISPFEIESVLLEIEEVAESGVIGAPDELFYEKVVAYICLNRKYAPSRELEIKIRMYVANKLSTVATPQELIFVDAIPKNKSGKIMRRVLKARFMGAEEGDTSTLEI